METLGISRKTLARLSWLGIVVFGSLPIISAVVGDPNLSLLLAVIALVTFIEVVGAIIMMISTGIISTEQDRNAAFKLTCFLFILSLVHLWSYSRI